MYTEDGVLIWAVGEPSYPAMWSNVTVHKKGNHNYETTGINWLGVASEDSFKNGTERGWMSHLFQNSSYWPYVSYLHEAGSFSNGIYFHFLWGKKPITVDENKV